MYIKGTDKDGMIRYINSNHVENIAIESEFVVVWFPDHLSIELQKTKELKEQLDSLLINQSSKGFENFK